MAPSTVKKKKKIKLKFAVQELLEGGGEDEFEEKQANKLKTPES